MKSEENCTCSSLVPDFMGLGVLLELDEECPVHGKGKSEAAAEQKGLVAVGVIKFKILT